MSEGHWLKEKRGDAYLDYLQRVSDHNYAMRAAILSGGESDICFTQNLDTPTSQLHWLPPVGQDFSALLNDPSILDLVHMDFNNPHNGQNLVKSEDLDHIISAVEEKRRAAVEGAGNGSAQVLAGALGGRGCGR